MKKLIFIIATIIVIILVILGINIFSNIQTLQESIEPEIRGISLSWGNVSSGSTEIRGSVTVFNPNSHPIPINDISCDILINDIKIGAGKTVGLEIKENAEFPVNFTANFDNSKFVDVWNEHIRRNEISDIEINLHLAVDLGIINVNVPYTIEHKLITDILENLHSVPHTNVEKSTNIPLLGEKKIFEVSFDGLTGDWGAITPQTSQITLKAKINNENPYPLLSPRVKFSIESNGLELAYGETALLNTIGPNSTKDIEITAEFFTGPMDEWFVKHVKQGEKSQLNISVYMGLDVDVEILGIHWQEDFTVTLWEDSQILETDLLNQIK